MKPNNVFSGILGLLFLASATIHASPDEVQNPSKSGLRIITEPVLAAAAVSLVNTYNQSGRYETILLEKADAGQLTGKIREEGTIALITGYSPALVEQPDLWRMAVGKEVIIPVMNDRNPEFEAIVSHGITPESLAGKASVPDGLLMIRGAGVETMVAGFLGVEPSEMQATLLSGTGELVQALERNPGAIAFARLSDVVELQSLQLAKGLSLVPLDLDANGTLSPLEDIYRTPSDLVHAIHIGKYPRMLSSKIYAIASQPPQEENQVAFLDWVVREGQDQLALAGFVQLTSFENQSALRNLHPPVPAITGAPMAAPATRVILWISFLLLAMLALVIAIIQRISLRTLQPLQEKSDRPFFGQSNFSFPGGLFFDRTHTWTFMEKDGKVRIGMDDFLLHVAGPVTRVDLKKPGATVKKGEPLFKLMQVGKQLEIKSPLSGKVVSQNSALLNRPGILNESPYSEGWIYLVEPENWLPEIKGYFMGDRYRQWIREEFTRLKDFFSKGLVQLMKGVPTPVIQDGGEIRYGILEEFGPEIWEEFQVRFINHQG